MMLDQFRGDDPPKEKGPASARSLSTNVYQDITSVSRDRRTVHPYAEESRRRYPMHRAVRTATGWLVLCIHWCGRRTWHPVAHRGEAIDIITGGAVR